MKKVLYALILFCSVSPAFAMDSTGCGLGSLALQGQSGWVMQTLAVTTNGFFGTQTFGITSGTSGCDRNGRISGGTKKIFAFLEKNMDQFAIDAARGHGETIDTIAALAGVSSETAGDAIKTHFAYIFDDADVSAVSVTLKVSNLLEA